MHYLKWLNFKESQTNKQPFEYKYVSIVFFFKFIEMKTINTLSLFILFSMIVTMSVGTDYNSTFGNNAIEYTPSENSAASPCITEQEYSFIESRIIENKKLLQPKNNNLSNSLNSITLLNWPLRPSPDLTDCSYYHISAYVDQNTTTGVVQDYNCGANTYDGHRGTDISIWPFNFYKMDNNLVEVIAAAAGTILDKHDGEFDRNCAATSVSANYVLIQHADGSYALYWHMKNGSITTKAIGQSVVAGELLGVVGSSGSSSGPHLHFEVWSGSTVATRVDPYAGTCNSLNASSWWNTQKPYKETGILKASVHTTDAVFPGCPATETSNESTSFQVPFQGPGLSPGYAKFYAFLRNEASGLNATLTILNPNGSTYLTWNYTSANDAKVRAWAWSKVLPTNPGTYTFRAVYNGVTCSSDFEITTSTGILSNGNSTDLKIYSSPSNRKTIFELKNSSIQQIELFNLLGKKVDQIKIIESKAELNSASNTGLYFYKLIDDKQLIYTGKLFLK